MARHIALALLLALCHGTVQAQPVTRLQPEDLEYKGAFRLPEGPEEIAWTWSGQALTYRPKGDPDGPKDGYPGSLFGIGHDWNTQVSEIAIPVPVISKNKDVGELNTAKTLQEFHNIRGDLFGELEQPRVGLEYLPRQGRQSTDKLYFCWGQHLQEGSKAPTHGWCELDLSKPQTTGPWRIGGYEGYVTNDYIFTIPKEWADAHTPGMRLVTGRSREGGQGAMGPALIAFGPWNAGNPPPSGGRLKAVPLLLYDSVVEENPKIVQGYLHVDHWAGGAWLTAGSKSAVIFAGTKGQGKCWYGFANGVVWPEEGPWPAMPPPPNDCRGYWATSYAAQILFYDPADLAAVVKGDKLPSEPQPYATMNIDECLFRIDVPQRRHRIGGIALDRARGHLYMMEIRGEEDDRSLIHVWKVKG